MRNEPLPQGADWCDTGVRYRVWAPEHERVDALIYRDDLQNPVRVLPLALDASGYHHAIDPAGSVGDLYKFRLDGGESFPDPASRWQPYGVHGPSAVIDATGFDWTDRDWVRPQPRDLSIYELHIGTFTPEGTFLAAIEKLPFLSQLGVTAIEIMPVADFPGDRNWGYDGVALYAPARAYGHPDDLRALVDAAHAAGLAVILDVVYNHCGPDGNYLGAYTKRFFNPVHTTPWGDGFNFDGEHSGPVRAFFLANPLYWMDEFHIDGFRLDATHAIADDSPRHILSEMTSALHERGACVIAEDAANDVRLIAPPQDDGYGFDAVWADDFHHSLRVALLGECESYLADFTGTLDELMDTLAHGWHYRGQYSRARRGNRGTECRHISPRHFLHCISNHDQVGNRAFGERLGHLVDAAAYRAASALLCLTPYTPMLFMGQEWNASSPFLFFTNHHTELGKLVTAGRRREFKEFAAFRDPMKREQIPDPQSIETFQRSKLDWSELDKNSGILELYRTCLALRRSTAVFRPEQRESWQVAATSFGPGAIRLKDQAGDWLILFSLVGKHRGLWQDEWLCRLRAGLHWERVLSTEETRFGGNDSALFDVTSGAVNFAGPALLIMHARATESA
jgi:maltooligosyltrehalose trehalohydrolase